MHKNLKKLLIQAVRIAAREFPEVVEVLKDLRENGVEIRLVKEDSLERAKTVVEAWQKAKDTQIREI